MRLKILGLSVLIGLVIALPVGLVLVNMFDDDKQNLAVVNRLQTHQDQPFDSDAYLDDGKQALIYFGYTSCPDICPPTLLVLADALDQMDPEMAARIVPVFVSVDPARDTPQVLEEYVQLFHPSLVGLTGAMGDIKSFAELNQIRFSEDVHGDHSHHGHGDHNHGAHGDDGTFYTISHTSQFILMDEHGARRAIPAFPSAVMLKAKLLEHIS
ncbi:MAG: SCO family protein [Pseudomonadota bacterium]